MTDELNAHADFRRAAEARVQSAENTVAHLSEQLTLVAREGQILEQFQCCKRVSPSKAPPAIYFMSPRLKNTSFRAKTLGPGDLAQMF